MICSHQGCTKTALGQWQRVGTDAETLAHAAALHEARMDGAAERRSRLKATIGELEAYKALQEDTADGHRVMARIDHDIDAIQAEHDKVLDPPEQAPRPIMVAVGGCEDHAVDVEKAGHLHAVDCAVGDCACETEPPPPSEPFAVVAHEKMAAKGWT